ncbi:MAG: two-component system, cell cycle sensor histidine kinase and response regulator CckA [Chthoniobacter sp.]|jgi:CheY-like chemotaxis protein|nr:two-component system, cell cycle sensor histidine kinase and response regulator CckA [Chthoniobacter sp.]
MASPDDMQWVKAMANELNNLLQVITESSQYLTRYAGASPDAQRYAEMMRTAINRATDLSRTLLDRSQAKPPFAGTNVHPFPMPGSMTPTTTPAPAPGLEPAAERGDVRIANPDGARELILIVDDENFVTLLAQRVLTDEGYRVITAKDGFQALDIYKKLQDTIQLVILDFTMPIMDGSEVFNELRQINPRVPVVLSSGFTEQDKLKWMLAKGLRGFIPKPYTQQKLLLQVRSTLDALKGERAI